MQSKWRRRVRELKQSVYALYLAARHPQTPWYAKALAGVVAAYALSPVDLIPDFIPVLGYLDDLILLPLGIWLAIRLIPAPVWAECRELARKKDVRKGRGGRLFAVLIVLLWLAILFLLARLLWPVIRGRPD